MGEVTDQIEREIRDARADLSRNLEALEDRARALMDWRAHYRRHTPLVLGAAFGVALLLGLKTINSATRRAHARHPNPSGPAVV